jgi:hypothetical protein
MVWIRDPNSRSMCRKSSGIWIRDTGTVLCTQRIIQLDNQCLEKYIGVRNPQSFLKAWRNNCLGTKQLSWREN